MKKNKSGVFFMSLGNQMRVRDVAKSCGVYMPSQYDDIAVWREDNDIKGFVAWRIVADEAELLSLAVSPSARGRGIGRALLEEVIARWDVKRVNKAFLEVRETNARAQYLYHACGFAEVGRRANYYPLPNNKDGEDAILMMRCASITSIL